jgi:hypothetical protein
MSEMHVSFVNEAPDLTIKPAEMMRGMMHRVWKAMSKSLISKLSLTCGIFYTMQHGKNSILKPNSLSQNVSPQNICSKTERKKVSVIFRTIKNKFLFSTHTKMCY